LSTVLLESVLPEYNVPLPQSPPIHTSIPQHS
jgi:hypothetical protein